MYGLKNLLKEHNYQTDLAQQTLLKILFLAGCFNNLRLTLLKAGFSQLEINSMCETFNTFTHQTFNAEKILAVFSQSDSDEQFQKTKNWFNDILNHFKNQKKTLLSIYKTELTTILEPTQSALSSPKQIHYDAIIVIAETVSEIQTHNEKAKKHANLANQIFVANNCNSVTTQLNEAIKQFNPPIIKTPQPNPTIQNLNLGLYQPIIKRLIQQQENKNNIEFAHINFLIITSKDKLAEHARIAQQICSESAHHTQTFSAEVICEKFEITPEEVIENIFTNFNLNETYSNELTTQPETEKFEAYIFKSLENTEPTDNASSSQNKLTVAGLSLFTIGMSYLAKEYVSNETKQKVLENGAHLAKATASKGMEFSTWAAQKGGEYAAYLATNGWELTKVLAKKTWNGGSTAVEIAAEAYRHRK